MSFLVYIFVFILGAIIGSFLNVVILRHNTGESIVKNGSRCFSCGKNLKWRELIPVLSFIIQKGRCRNCKSKISIQYPIVEFLTGLTFLSVFIKFQNTDYWLLTTGYYLIIFSLLVIIAVYDFRHQIIPNKFVYIFDTLAFFSVFITHYSLRITLYDFLPGLILFAFFGLIWLLSKGKAMGLGDAKLALGIGWILGLEKGILSVILSFWLGALIGVFLLFFYGKRYNIKSKIAFGPFLVIGFFLAFFWGSEIIKTLL